MTLSRATMPRDITGRDDYILNKTLAYAITTIENLPKVRQESSDCDDMRALLEARVPNAAQRAEVMRSARAHMGYEKFFMESHIAKPEVIK